MRAERKVGVDPAPRIPRWKWVLHPNALIRGSFFRTSSERFFDALEPERTFDVIFIDGDHSFAQSHRDVERALEHLARDGVILVHDCNPPTPASASPDSADSGGGPWCGEVYKTIVELRATRPDLAVETIAADFGIGVVRRGSATTIDLQPEWVAQMTWADLDRDRERLLGLRDPGPENGSEVDAAAVEEAAVRRRSRRSPRARTGASVVSAITASSPSASAPTAAETMFTPCSPKAVPTRPIMPGWSA